MAAGLDCKLMVPDGCYEDAFIAVGRGRERQRPLLRHLWRPAAREAARARARSSSRSTRASYGSEPEGYAIYGYEAAKVALEAIERAGVKDREAIVEACLAIKDFDQGALGTWSFDANGDTTLTHDQRQHRPRRKVRVCQAARASSATPVDGRRARPRGRLPRAARRMPRVTPC